MSQYLAQDKADIDFIYNPNYLFNLLIPANENIHGVEFFFA